MSVLVPLSMFATDPDAFRAQFLEERGKRFVRLEDAITKGKSPARTPLSKWRVTRILPASVQSELGRWQEDYNAERERQGGVSGFLCLERLFQGQPNEAALCI